MENYIPLADFADHLKDYFVQNPEKLPQNIIDKELHIKPFQNAWMDTRLEPDHQYIRYMDILFLEENEPANGILHSYIITYLCTGNIIDVMKMES